MRAVASGMIIFVLLLLVDQFSIRFGLTSLQRFGDDLLGGIIVGLITFIVERRRSKYLTDRLTVIVLMNHHVRNALQAIKFAHHTEHHVRVIDDSVARIEWALREVLSGKMVGADQRPPQC
jgi:hypothetical protein